MRNPKPYLLTLVLLGAFFVSAALAHATLVLGTVSSTPATPQPGEDFTLNLTLEDPIGVAVEDAVVYAEFRPPGAPLESEPVREVRLEETSAGAYSAVLSLPNAGGWNLFLRDQTFRQEEATANLIFAVGNTDAASSQSFVFPPTATGPANIWTWLGWLIGLPVIAAVGRDRARTEQAVKKSRRVFPRTNRDTPLMIRVISL